MGRWRARRLGWMGILGGVFATIAGTQAATLSAQSGGFDCHAAAQIVEQQAHLPPGLLLAIGRVETGRLDPETGRTEPWSWSTNMAGVSHYFATETEAIDWTAAQLGGVQRSIDVGCFQINLMYHPQAFATLEQAFDPIINARYAAQFLISLYQKSGNWQQAAEQYHSADPARGVPYGNRVLAFLEGRDGPTAPIIPASYSLPQSGRSWVQAGPAGFGIQIFVPVSSTNMQPAAVLTKNIIKTASGGMLVMMPGASSQASFDPRRLPDFPTARAPASNVIAAHGNDRGLPKVYTPARTRDPRNRENVTP